MNTGNELEDWLRNRASQCTKQAASRRSNARSGESLTDEDCEDAHIEDRIATKLDDEAAMLLRFAGWVASVKVIAGRLPSRGEI